MARSAAGILGFALLCLIAAVGMWRFANIPKSDTTTEFASIHSQATAPEALFEDNADFHGPLLAVAANYRSYGRLDERLRFGPPPCDGPVEEPRQEPSYARFSATSMDDPHAGKLYFLFAKNQRDYGYDVKKQDVGQAIVKESWLPELHDANTRGVRARKDASGDFYVPLAVSPTDGKTYQTGAQSTLFIMLKLDESTPGTDQGWVYGTVTPDGKKVTASGLVKQCMNCHRDAPNDRMFGLAERKDL